MEASNREATTAMLTINNLESELEKYRLELENKSRDYDLCINNNSKLSSDLDTLSRECIECRDEVASTNLENKELIKNLKKGEDNLKEIESRFYHLNGSHSGCEGIIFFPFYYSHSLLFFILLYNFFLFFDII